MRRGIGINKKRIDSNNVFYVVAKAWTWWHGYIIAHMFYSTWDLWETRNILRFLM